MRTRVDYVPENNKNTYHIGLNLSDVNSDIIMDRYYGIAGLIETYSKFECLRCPSITQESNQPTEVWDMFAVDSWRFFTKNEAITEFKRVLNGIKKIL